MTIDSLIAAFAAEKTDSDQLIEHVVHDAERGVVVATNGKILIVAPERYHTMESVIPLVKGYPDYKSVIKMGDMPTICELSAQKLLDHTLSMPKTHVYDKCDYCEGYGMLSTQNGKTRECKECGGSGDGECLYWGIHIPGTGKHGSKSYAMKLDGHYLNPNLMEVVAMVGNALGEPIRITCMEEYKMQFAVGDVVIMLALLLKDMVEEDKKYVEVVTIEKIQG